MSVSSDTYYVNGPPSGLFDRLLSSRLIKKFDVPQIEQNTQVTTKQDKRTLNTRTKSKSSAVSLSPVKSTAKKYSDFVDSYMNKKIRESTTATIGKRYKPTPIEDIKDTYKGFALPPERPRSRTASETFASLPKISRDYTTRKESGNLLKQFEALENERSSIDMNNDDPLNITEKLNALISRYYYSWNELILQIKANNSDHAKINVFLKTFFQSVLHQLPRLNDRFVHTVTSKDDDIKNLKSEICNLKEENQKLTERTHDLQKENESLCKTNKEYSANIAEEEDEKNGLHVQINELKQNIDELKYNFDRLNGKNKALTQLLEQRESTINDCREQISKQEELLLKYEDVGAGFKPLYKKALDEIEALKKELISKEEEISTMIKNKAVLVDNGENPDDFGKLNVNHKQHKKGKGKSRGLDKNSKSSESLIQTKVHNDLASSGNLVGITKNLSCSNILENKMSSLSPPNIEKHLEKCSRSENSCNDSLSQVIADMSVPESHDNNIQPKQIQLSDTNVSSSSHLSKVSEKSLPESKLPPLKSREETITVNNSFHSRTLNVDTKALPEDYDVSSDTFIDCRVILAYIYKILPSLATESKILTDIFVHEKRDGKKRSFSWTIRQVILIMRNAFQLFAGHNIESIKDLIAIFILELSKNKNVSEQIESSLYSSLFYYREISRTVQFFLKFMSGEFSLNDFQFFNMLLSVCYNIIYPNIEKVIENPGLTNDNGIFLINIEFLDKISKATIRDSFPEEITIKLVNKAPRPEFPCLVSFWDFAEEMILLFRRVHSGFHKRFKYLTMITSALDFDYIMQSHFKDIIYILFPFIEEKEYKDMWKRIKSSSSSNSDDYVYKSEFIKYMCAQPFLAETIISIPCIDDFESVFTEMNDAVGSFFTFLKDRFVGFVPTLISMCPANIKFNKDLVLKLRDCFLKCDPSSALTYYIHLLRELDLKLSNLRPFYVLSTSTTADDLNRMINFIMMREHLAMHFLGIEAEIPPKELIMLEKSFNKRAKNEDDDNKQENQANIALENSTISITCDGSTNGAE